MEPARPARPDASGVMIMSKRALLAADSGVPHKMISRTLEREGFDVTLVEDGKLAADTSLCGEFKLLVTGVNLPNLDGLGLVRQMRKNPNYGNMPIVAVTTEDDQYLKMPATAAGVTDWMVGPLDEDDFGRSIGKVCRSAGIS
jgi:two-component system chemotaxis response regulator CheY